jgi:HEAT repeat protein
MSRKNWTSEKIFTRLLTNKTNKTYWDNIFELRRRPNQEVFDRASALAKSCIDKQIIIGIDILQQLGNSPRFNLKETQKIHFELLNSPQSNKVLRSIFHGIGHNPENRNAKQITTLIQFKDVKNLEVKHALISALGGVKDSKAIDTLIEFSEHKDSEIRDWATFSLGSLLEIDTEIIRVALWNRVQDDDATTRHEAMSGLALRKADGIKETIITELKSGNFGTPLFDGIKFLKDKDFIPYLKENLAEVEESTHEGDKGWSFAIQGTIDELQNF